MFFLSKKNKGQTSIVSFQHHLILCRLTSLSTSLYQSLLASPSAVLPLTHQPKELLDRVHLVYLSRSCDINHLLR